LDTDLVGDDKLQEDIWLASAFGTLLTMEAFTCGSTFGFGNQAHPLLVLLKRPFNSPPSDLNCEAADIFPIASPTARPPNGAKGHKTGASEAQIVVPIPLHTA